MRPTTSFLHYDPATRVEKPKSLTAQIRAAQEAAKYVLEFNVKAAIRRKEIESPQDHARKLRAGDLVLDEDGMRQLVRSMEASAARSLPIPTRPRTRARAALEVDCLERFVFPKEDEEEMMFLAESFIGIELQ